MSKPTVPEVSLIFDDSKQFTLNNETQPKSYKVWKQQQQQLQQQQSQEPIANILPNRIQSSDRKKIVTFDLPVESHAEPNALPQIVENAPIAQCQQLDLSLYDPKTSSNGTGHSIPAKFTPTELQCMQQQQQQQQFNGYVPYRNDNGMYMTGPLLNNTPNKPTPNQHFTNQVMNNCGATKEITLNEIYQLLQNMQVNNRTSPPQPNVVMSQQAQAIGGLDRYQQINNFPNTPDRFDANANVPHSSTGDPTTRDIFNVILKQQEQLMNLQSQVQLLLMRTAHTAPILQHQQHSESAPYTNRIAHTNSNVNEIDTRKKQMSVMTSLEINVKNSKSNGSIQAAANFNTPENTKRIVAVKGSQGRKQCGCVCNCDEQKNVQSSDSSSNNDDNLDASPDRGETQTGWTFYGNILNQVNDVLQSTPPPANVKTNDSNNTPNIAAAAANIDHHCINSPNNISCAHSSHSSMPKQIRTAQFKQVGFQIDDVNISAMSKR